ncbi:glycosyl transferase [Clostridium frigoris]|uniref:Glycosyl transferase n=1 Tax=Clostridium frigoris TaxID=205327 RepID=A0ABS6BSF9_9CLOT|nr:glycosyltransferase [Clostridium frigoris]MBU3159856.1 glycosyl transferase [Clostridium frigoris]
MSIPKIIHYCWFGRNSLPPLAKECIDSWKKYCPDYEIIEWNEDNFDINSNKYVKQAYKAKKYAFVTDYVRLYVLYAYGGIYMDTDVEVLKSLDKFLKNEAFSGFETIQTVPTGIMACVKKFPFFNELLSYYDSRDFMKKDGSYDLTTNVTIITDYCIQNGLKLNNTLQTVKGFAFYPKNYFCPKDHLSGNIHLTSETYTIHHFAGSWISRKDKMKAKTIRLLGPNITHVIVDFKKIIKKIAK